MNIREAIEKLPPDATYDDAKAQARLRYGNALVLSGQVDRGLSELHYVIDDFPRTISGKVQKFQLREQFAEVVAKR